MRSPAFQAWIHSMPKFNLVSRLCLPHCFTPIKNYHVAPIVHFPAEEKTKPNFLFWSVYSQNKYYAFCNLKSFLVSSKTKHAIQGKFTFFKTWKCKVLCYIQIPYTSPASITDWICSSQITLTKRLIWCYLVTLERPLSVKPIQLARTIKTTNRLQWKFLNSLSSPIRH